MAEHVAHLADALRPGATACGEPWQGWQEPDDGLPRVVIPPHAPPRPHADRVRQCQACARAPHLEPGAVPVLARTFAEGEGPDVLEFEARDPGAPVPEVNPRTEGAS